MEREGLNTAKKLSLPYPDSNLQRFYDGIGHFTNQKTKTAVKKLAPHQVQIWHDQKISKYCAYIKSQKIGVSALCLMQDIEKAIGVNRGQQVLLVGQTKDKAKEHLQNLRKMLVTSPRYSDYLIDKPTSEEQLLKDEKSKIDAVYIRNPDKPVYPASIIPLGIGSAGSLISFSKVGHIHLSDITLADTTEERLAESLGGLFSRLANTDGTMTIECPPRGPSGKIFDIADEFRRLNEDHHTFDEPTLTSDGFLVRRYTYQVGIDCGMITPEFIEKERKRLGVLFPMYYEADFYSGDKTWFSKEHVEQISEEATDMYEMFS